MKRIFLLFAALALLLASCTSPAEGTSSDGGQSGLTSQIIEQGSLPSEPSEQSGGQAHSSDFSYTSEEADTSFEQSSTDTALEERTVINYKYVKAIWLSQFDMSPVLKLGESQYTAAVTTMLNNIKSDGFNTVIVQIRPYGDSLYDSDYFPASRFVTDCDYDPVGIFVGLCHDRELSVHAWINPYRLESDRLMAERREWYDSDSLCHWEGRYYLDPSTEYTKTLVCEGAREALTRYEFDGLHMDDYFYPTSDPSFDARSFNESGQSDLRAFREESVNDLVRRLYATTKEVDDRLLYGISPAGNLATVRSVYYADVEKWCGGSGYIDYIMPQVYFGFLHQSCPFDRTVDAWAKIVTSPDVRLIVGMTLGKACSGSEDKYAGTAEGKTEWLNHKDVIARELEYVYGHKSASGFSMFCYQYLYDPLTGSPNPAIAQERSSFEKLLK